MTRPMVQNSPKKCVNVTTDSNNQRLFAIEVFLTLSQIWSYVCRIATKRKQLSASEYPAAEIENIPRCKNEIIRSSAEFHSHPFENEEFRQLCEMKRKKGVFNLFLFYFCFFFVFAVVGVFVVLQGCKNMARKNCTQKYEMSK